MDAINNLLDKAREHCSLPSDGALAERLGVSRQLVSQWRKGHNPLADERIAQVARAAGEDAGVWLVRIRAEQTTGDAAKAWAKLARQLGTAATVAAVGLLAYGMLDVSAHEGLQSAAMLNVVGGMHYAK